MTKRPDGRKRHQKSMGVVVRIMTRLAAIAQALAHRFAFRTVHQAMPKISKEAEAMATTIKIVRRWRAPSL
jgi:hypothetical protein